MMKQLWVLGFLSLNLLLQPVMAQPNSNAELVKRIEELERRADEKSGMFDTDAFTFGGTVEVEGFYSDSIDYVDQSQSDVVLATVELGFGFQLSEDIAAAVTTLHEEDDTAFEIDVATIDAVIVDKLLSVSLGQTYIPFGTFETYMVNDTLALELAETRETMVMLSGFFSVFSANIYVFNGDVDKNNTVTNYGIRLGYSNDRVSANIDYLSNVADSDGISGALVDGPGIPVNPSDLPDAVSAHVLVNLGALTLIGEYLKTGEFSDADWVTGSDIEATAAQFEAGLNLDDWNVAVAYQQSNDAVFFGLPETRLSVAGSYDLTEHTAMAVELWHDKDYEVSDGGSSESSTSIVIQVAVNF